MTNVRTIVYILITCVAMFAVWYTGENANNSLRHEARINCHQDLVLTRAVNDLHGSIKKFLKTARKARLDTMPKTKENLEVARTYQDIINHIEIVPPPVCLG